MSDERIEQMIRDKEIEGPRVTPEDIDQLIVSGDYHVFPGTTVTVCCLTLRNGFTVIGQSACADPHNFDEEVGKTIAYEDAWHKIWPLEGYLLRQMLHEARNHEAAPTDG